MEKGTWREISRHTSVKVNFALITARSKQSDSSAWEFRGECDHQHCYEYERCESLEGVLREVAEMQDKANTTEEKRGRLKFAFNETLG